MPKDERTATDYVELAKAVADESRDGVILCGCNGEVIHVNPAAAQMLSDAHADDIQRISIAAMTVGQPQRAQLNGFFVTARSLPIKDSGAVGIVTIRVNAPLPSEEALRGKFGLSRREAQVAVLLADRRTDAEIAAALGISWHTVRSHVERIFAALDCHTRRDAAAKLKSH